MALLNILSFPNPRLRRVAKEVRPGEAGIEELCRDMLETMYAASGIGLAAIQVGVEKRVVVMDLSEAGDQPQIFINPEVEPLGVETHEFEEGCLSVPGFSEPVSRPARVRISAMDLEGERREVEADGLLAVCIQHEIDHLNGKLFVDYVSDLKRRQMRKQLKGGANSPQRLRDINAPRRERYRKAALAEAAS